MPTDRNGHLINALGELLYDSECSVCRRENKETLHYYDDPQRIEQNLPLRRWTFYPATLWDKVLTWPYRAALAIWRML